MTQRTVGPVNNATKKQLPVKQRLERHTLRALLSLLVSPAAPRPCLRTYRTRTRRVAGWMWSA